MHPIIYVFVLGIVSKFLSDIHPELTYLISFVAGCVGTAIAALVYRMRNAE